MVATRIGIPMPAQVNARPSGRYALRAPDAPVGSLLRVITREGSIRFVEVASPHGKRLFVDLDGTEVDFCDWDYATRAEVESFKFERRVGRYADAVELHGAPAFASAIRGLPELDREALLQSVSDELKVRDKGGKASQVLAFLGEK